MGRKSVARQHITTLLEQEHLLSAVDIQSLLDEHKIPLNKTTIYRTLEQMLKRGELCRHSLGNDVLLYELRSHHHDHLVCEHCGVVRSSDCALPSPVSIDGFSITHHHVTLFGLCESCQNS